MNNTNEAINYLAAATQSCESGKKFLNQFSDNEKYDILMASKQLLAYVAVSNGVNMIGKCYECKHRRNLPGDTHSKCSNIFAIVVGDDYGISKGWFSHPFNFDPVWLRYCDSFESIN